MLHLNSKRNKSGSGHGWRERERRNQTSPLKSIEKGVNILHNLSLASQDSSMRRRHYGSWYYIIPFSAAVYNLVGHVPLGLYSVSLIFIRLILSIYVFERALRKAVQGRSGPSNRLSLGSVSVPTTLETKRKGNRDEGNRVESITRYAQ